MRAIVLLTAVALAASPALAGVDEGGVMHDKVPWSGYWWPHHRGGLQAPAAKHDDLTGKKAKDWEEKNNPKTKPDGKLVPEWYGFCHAWAAASVAEKEPRKAVTVNGTGGRPKTLTVGEQKGLLTLCHTADVANSFGERNFGTGGDNDLAPDELWRLLKLYVQQQNIPLILDTDAGEQVWNYPVYSYRVTYTPTGRPNGEVNGLMELFMADDGVYPEYTGTLTRHKQYKFTCQMNGDKVVSGSGKWASPTDHPDFAWYPHTTAAQNPEVDVTAVRKWVDATGGSTGGTGPVIPGQPLNPGPVQPGGGGTTGGTTTTGGGTGPVNVLALTPQQLAALVVDKTSAYEFDVWVDKLDGGVYTAGDGYTVSGRCAKDGYVYLLELQPADVTDPAKVLAAPLRLLYPLPGQDNRVKAKEEFTFPRGDGKDKVKATFAVGEEIGRYKVKAVFSTRPLLLSGIDYSNQGQQQQQQQQKPQQQQSSGLRLNEQDHKQVKDAVVQSYGDKAKPDQIQQQTLNTKPKDFLPEFSQDESPFLVKKKPGKPEPGKPEQGQTDPGKTDPGKTDPGKPPPAKQEEKKGG